MVKKRIKSKKTLLIVFYIFGDAALFLSTAVGIAPVFGRGGSRTSLHRKALRFSPKRRGRAGG
ncbi:unnamed protein product, partial [Nesidiocoris tenuis]